MVPIARHISERFCPSTGVPVRLGKVWPPRLMVHDVCSKGMSRVNEAITSVFFLHELRRPVEVVVRPAMEPAHDPQGHPIPGLSVGRAARLVETPRRWERLPIPVQWTPELQTRLFGLPWVRKGLIIELKASGVTRTFHWYVYLTPDPPTLPRHASMYDDHPHYNWVTHEGDPLRIPQVSERWIELPAPMSSPALSPACWIQARRLADGEPGPESRELLPVFPLEPAVPRGAEVTGWNGALGGHDRRPMLVPLSIVSTETESGAWAAGLEYWDTGLEAQSAPHITGATELEPPTTCVWPRVLSCEPHPIQLLQFRNPTRAGCDVKLNLHVRLPDDAEPIETSGADILLGAEVIGHWLGIRMELYAGREFSLPCVVDQDRIALAGGERVRLTIVFRGRPSRGICAEEQSFRTEDGPYVQLKRIRYRPSPDRRPWLVIDHGTEGTCAALAYFDGYAPRVHNVQFAEGPIHPSRVYIAPGQGGAWTLTDQPTEDALYTTGIKLGLRYGDGAHPGCPDHVSAIEVARFYLKRFLLDLKERAAWFPLEDADVLVSFPPRLACMPRFVGSLRETFLDVIPEVLWPAGRVNRVRFREEAFLVAMPSLYKDLQMAPLRPNHARLYWVMDFGGGTTDVCGFLCRADEHGEEHTISNFTYPQRFPHHLSGNDITAAFYRTLRRHLMHAGVVVGGEAQTDRRFAFPEDPFPSTRSTHTALLNQTALRELADLSKCTPGAAQESLTVRDLAKSLRSTTICSVDDVTTTLVSLLGVEAARLGARTVQQLHADVIDPQGSKLTAGGMPARTAAPSRETTNVPCAHCQEPHVLPIWVFSTTRAFRFRCKRCGEAQEVRGVGDAVLPEGSDDGSPTILAWGDHDRGDAGPLLIKQDAQNYRVGNWQTLRRWVEERRVGPDDQVSQTGSSWDRLRDRPELADLFDDDEPLPVWDEPKTEPGAPVRAVLPWAHEEIGLGDEIDRFLDACAAALVSCQERLPQELRSAEVIVLLAGRASLFEPIADGVHRSMPGRVVHLTQDWVARTYGDTGTVDPAAGLKTLTANGGGLFALNQSSTDTSHLLLSFRTDVLDCDTYLDIGTPEPHWLTRTLGLRNGHRAAALRPTEQVPPGGRPPVPVGQALLGEIRLQVEGLPQDRAWEPWVTVGRGLLSRIDGHRARATEALELQTTEDGFKLVGLTLDAEIELENLLPRLELLGEDPG